MTSPSTTQITNATTGGSARLRSIPIWLVIFGVFSTIGLVQFASVDWSRPLSIYDEVPHVDYTFRLAQGTLTTWDDVYSQRTLGIADCLEAQSTNPQCRVEKIRDPRDRWPNGHSYEALQTPVGYLPFVIGEVLFVNEQADHYSQIRRLRMMNGAVWLLLAGMWTALVLQVTRHRLAAAAASVAVATNPLLFDRFTYVTNDGMAIAAATGVAAWLMYLLRRGPTLSRWSAMGFSAVIGLAVGMIKPTAMIVLLPMVVAVLVTQFMRRGPRALPSWWGSVGLIGLVGVVSSFVYSAYIDSRSELDFHTVLSVILPKGPLDLPTASVLRLTDVSELVTGSGARTELTPYEWGMMAPSVWVIAFSLLCAASFLVSLSLRTNAFPLLKAIDPRVLGYAVLMGFIAMLIAHPALHFIRGEFHMPFTAGRFQATMIPLAGVAMLGVFQRFPKWAWVTIALGFLVGAFFSGPLHNTWANIGGFLSNS